MVPERIQVLEYPMRPKSGSLWSRLRTSSSLAVFLSVLFCAISVPALAAAAEGLPSLPHGNLIASDGNSPEFSFLLGSFNGLVIEDEVDETGKPRGLELVRRVPAGVSSLGNNQFQTRDIQMGETHWWYFPQQATESQSANGTSDSQSDNSSKRSTTTVYLSLTICSKPSLNTSDSDNVPELPQLDMYVSVSESLQKPGPGEDSSKQSVYTSDEGYMNAVVSAEGDVFIGIAAPKSGSYSGFYSYQMAASTDDYFHIFNDDTSLLSLVDSGSNAALLATVSSDFYEYLTIAQQRLWDNGTALYTMFVNNANTTALAGMQRSYCALEQHSQIGKGNNVATTMSNRTTSLDYSVQEQFYITGLNRSSTYVGIVAITGNSTSSGNGIVRGGGAIWQPTKFTTKTDDNCAVLFGLDFCSDVAYAVPSNPSISLSDLRQKYDTYASNLYQNFNYSLQQIQCNTSNETIFSMAVSCDDCASAYKSWLCAVTIPRCADFSDTNNASLLVRNAGQAFPNGTSITNQTFLTNPATNYSRNSMIDSDIKPGPYKEILPSVDICHDLVKNCPMTLGFICPKGKWLTYSYRPSAASHLLPSLLATLSVTLSISSLLWLL